jgi:hypothetical protein
MRINKGIYFLIIILLACTTGMAQMSAPFSMSPIASSNGISSSNGGSPIVMTGSGKCLTVSSGLNALNMSNSSRGSFGASCAETPPAAVLLSITSLKVFPNPTHSTSILKCEGKFDANLSCQVRIIGMDGKVVMSQMVPMKDLVAGYTINASAYPVGTYAVSVDFMNQQYALKLIKL